MGRTCVHCSIGTRTQQHPAQQGTCRDPNCKAHLTLPGSRYKAPFAHREKPTTSRVNNIISLQIILPRGSHPSSCMHYNHEDMKFSDSLQTLPSSRKRSSEEPSEQILCTQRPKVQSTADLESQLRAVSTAVIKFWVPDVLCSQCHCQTLTCQKAETRFFLKKPQV